MEVFMGVFGNNDISYLDDFALKKKHSPLSIFNQEIAKPVSTRTHINTKERVLNQENNKPNWLKDKFRTGIVPFSYEAFGSRVIDALFGGSEHRKYVKKAQEDYPERTDAWLMYLGYPQEHNTFKESKYRPSKSTKDSKYYTFNMDNEDILNNVIGVYGSKPLNKKILKDGDIMGRYTVDKGWDKEKNDAYVSIYDKWDFPFSDYVPNSIGGKPFEIYDRFYYKDLKEHLFKKRQAGEIKDYDEHNRAGANLRDFFDQSNELLYDEHYDRNYREYLFYQK
jgi:hypothetical protein